MADVLSATETSSALLMSLSVPGTTITPVPITKLPNSSGQSTLGRGVALSVRMQRRRVFLLTGAGA